MTDDRGFGRLARAVVAVAVMGVGGASGFSASHETAATPEVADEAFVVVYRAPGAAQSKVASDQGARLRALAAAPTATADGLNWAALAKCESGGNPRAVNPAGYYGLYQFSLSTWHSVGGAGNPIDASPAEQTARAQALYARGGASQWGCGRHLSD